MEQPQSKGMRMVFVLVVSATLFAVATFLAIMLLANRPEPPEATASPALLQVFVDGKLITLNTDPEKAVYLPGEDLSASQPSTQTLEQVPPELVASPIPEPPTPTLPPPTPVPEPVIFIDYLVQPGDSLYGISEQQNSAIELMALHGIDDDDLVPGQTIRLPVANPSYCSGSLPYVVRDKDTVFRIARQFNTTPEALRTLNNLDQNFTVRVTQVICVPFG